jgi:hypothetical protein
VARRSFGVRINGWETLRIHVAVEELKGWVKISTCERAWVLVSESSWVAS